MAVRRRELCEGGARRLGPGLHDAFRVEAVARDPDGGQARADGRERRGGSAAAAADVVRVHRAEQRPIALRVEARDELRPVAREVRLDCERLVGAALPPEADLELLRRAVREHPGHPCDREPGLRAAGLEGPALDVVPSDRPRRVRRGRREDDGGARPLGERRRELQRDHSAEGPSGHESQRGDSKRFHEREYEERLVARRDRGLRVGLPNSSERSLERRPVARPQQVRAEHGPLRGVDRLSGPDDASLPPAERLRRTRERVKDEDDVVSRLVDCSFEDVRLAHVAQDLAGLEREARRHVEARGGHDRTALRSA